MKIKIKDMSDEQIVEFFNKGLNKADKYRRMMGVLLIDLAKDYMLSYSIDIDPESDDRLGCFEKLAERIESLGKSLELLKREIDARQIKLPE